MFTSCGLCLDLPMRRIKRKKVVSYGEPWKPCAHGKTMCDCLMIWSIPLDATVVRVLSYSDTEYTGGNGLIKEVAKDYMRRIAACVNYCKGVSTEELERRQLSERRKD